MNCTEFHRVLPEVIGNPRTNDQEAHLQSCRDCAGLVSDLDAIAVGAHLLQASDEPSPRVWNAIEAALRQEGLIHPPQARLTVVPAVSQDWRLAWLVPVAAAVLVISAIIGYQTRGPRITGAVKSPVTVAGVAQPTELTGNADDEQMLAIVSSQMPSMRATYEADLRNVNSYILDAEQSLRTNPNDEEARQHLMDAYEEKSMVYEMAMDRSLP
jgi:hypothetical protein